jgi:hypothetical protein
MLRQIEQPVQEAAIFNFFWIFSVGSPFLCARQLKKSFFFQAPIPSKPGFFA